MLTGRLDPDFTSVATMLAGLADTLLRAVSEVPW